MQDKANKDLQKESVEEITNGHKQPQDERKSMRTRTFTRWINVFLQKSDPPLVVQELFTDIRDGRILMALLEQLSGCKLLYRFRSSPHHVFRLNNIAKALSFLDDRHVKLLGIDASSIADGIPSVVLNLVWNIILYFQVKEVTRGLQRHLSSSLSSLSMSSYPSSSDLSPPQNDIGSFSCSTLPSKGKKAAREPKYHGKAIKTLLHWVQRCTSKFGVEVHDFGKSWRNGLAFLALIESNNPGLVDLRESLTREPRENLQLAFTIAHHNLEIPPLLDPEDVLCSSPDEQSIITYVSMFLGRCSDTDEACTTDLEVPEIPNFRSLDSVGFGETVADDPKAQALLKGHEESSEQLLWKQWDRRPSGVHGNFSTTHTRGVLKPPSPLDTVVVSQEIHSWIEKTYGYQVYNRPGAGEEEEGIYNLSALDSDEEEAYSYILDLNKDVSQQYNQLNRRVPRVEEETAEELLLNAEQTEETKHLEEREISNVSGCRHQEDSIAQSVQPEVRARSVIHGTSDRDKNESSFREMANNRAVFDMEPEDDSRRGEESEEERVVRGQSNDDAGYCEEEREEEKTENDRLLMHGCDETEIAESKEAKLFEVDCRNKVREEENGSRHFEKCTQVGEKRAVYDEEERDNLMTLVDALDKKLEEEDKIKEKERGNTAQALHEVRGVCTTTINPEEESDMKVATLKIEDLTGKDEEKEQCREVISSLDLQAVMTTDSECKMRRRELIRMTTTATNGRVHVRSDGTAVEACQSFSRGGGLSFQSFAAFFHITPSELKVILVLWIVLYCCLLLSEVFSESEMDY